ncbi:2-succinyl-5-enolpyruvyl-6-hydroxy-3-cyclohexene-1-carboxylate synthase [Belliella buryatensis]|uniref:2-succinyl-5-enolpyruvyl-6-hydroxy-3-cyclohexene-1-carboxylate synthase n=1 Tax=Belliella buryatensis TaxID=1500549 RepID=A0A239AIJ1_9BACT|nr:2-succinyl-5-enolpyruvyl-6-hydroxy-3-cyclohexene-1-carboxylic-acid synthase [Belliella buryatensis]SNR94854.1 2-succinyl-5-enolpyruvyl-6-hydroxy-3-cyclohexene-1-carboxylate synthase [Belliella buryatensis]
MVIQPIIDLVSLCAQKGIKNAILSPGSRCAPITLAFARHSEIKCRTVSDERAAAFIAMGMAQQLNQPVALVCTSGSAAYNYAPAVAEAYFQQIPLLVITADRPAEWIDQWDGQTIRQPQIYGKHVKGSFDFPDEFSKTDKVWHAQRMVNEAINLSIQFPAGPVHLNIPLREPFYPEVDEQFEFKPVKNIEVFASESYISPTQETQLEEKLKVFQKILIIPGQQRPDAETQESINLLASSGKAVVVTDTISNLQSAHTISFHDHFIGNSSIQEQLQPDLIVSFGNSIISKSLKLFLRNSTAAHWHVQDAGYSPDTFQSLTTVINVAPISFLKFLNLKLLQNQKYFTQWKSLDNLVKKSLTVALNKADFGEYKAISKVLNVTPDHAKIHLANSMSVRYVNFLGSRNQEIICNRGTSGIDGSNSTAVGCSFTTKDPVTLITGDMAFFYDRNAFWHNYSTPNLRIVILNNHAGGIFRLIDGPARQPELEEFFETNQALTAENLAKDFGFEYIVANDDESLEKGLNEFYSESIAPKILEIISESPKNAEILKKIKEMVASSL